MQSSYSCIPWKTPGYIFYIYSSSHEISVTSIQTYKIPPQKSSHDNMTNLAYLCVGMVLGLLEIMIEIIIKSIFCIDFLAV